MLSLCQLPPLLSFLTWMITIASFLWETFLLSPGAILKPFSKQHSIETVLDLINEWNPICPLLSVLLHQMVCRQYRLSQHLALAAGTEVDGSMVQQAKREARGRDGVSSESCYCLY